MLKANEVFSDSIWSASRELSKHYVRVLSALARVGYRSSRFRDFTKDPSSRNPFRDLFRKRDQHDVVIRYSYEELNVSF